MLLQHGLRRVDLLQMNESRRSRDRRVLADFCEGWRAVYALKLHSASKQSKGWTLSGDKHSFCKPEQDHPAPAFSRSSRSSCSRISTALWPCSLASSAGVLPRRQNDGEIATSFGHDIVCSLRSKLKLPSQVTQPSFSFTSRSALRSANALTMSTWPQYAAK